MDENGSYENDNEITKSSFKFLEQERFCLGVTQILTYNGKEGKRSDLIDYTGKNILTMENYEKRIEEEIKELETWEGIHQPRVGSKLNDLKTNHGKTILSLFFPGMVPTKINKLNQIRVTKIVSLIE